MKHILAIDGGGSSTRAGLYTENGDLLAEAEAGPCNALEESTENIISTFINLRESLPNKTLDCVAAGIAGAGIGGKLDDMARLLARIFSPNRIVVSNDLIPVFQANVPSGEGLICIAGTGSSVWARNTHGEKIRLGGYGPILGDEGSAYRIVIDAIRFCIANPTDTIFVRSLLEQSGIDSVNDFSAFVSQNPRSRIASLCPTVIALAEVSHLPATSILNDHVWKLGQHVMAGKEQLHLSDSAPVWLHGGLFQHNPWYLQRFSHFLHQHWSSAKPALAPLSGHKAAFELHTISSSGEGIVVLDTGLAVTRQGTEDSANKINLDALSANELFYEMHKADIHATASLQLAAYEITHVMKRAAAAFEVGGRLIYMGAGTSGRLGVLDASECPPTFGVSDGLVIGIIAGGDAALRHSIEGAEDDPAQGGKDLTTLNPPVNAKDVVVGITASGTAPYVLGGLETAKASGAATALICCNPVPADRADTILFLDTGAEVLPGSTRLKAGTATKMTLNQLTTGAMALWGHIHEGYMVGVRPVNAKLRIRSIRITAALTDLPDEEAETWLNRAEGSIPVAVLMAKHGLESKTAQKLLQSVEGRLRPALEKLAE